MLDVTTNLEKRLEAIFESVLGLVPRAEIQRNNIPQWDSLKHVELVFAIEDQFSIRLTANDVAEMNSYGEIQRMISEKGSA